MQPDTRRDSIRDRRRDHRRPVDVFVNRFVNGYPYLCRATDISRSGMRLLPLLEPRATPPRFMGLQFQLPGSTEIVTASGEAVSIDEDGGPVGVRFTKLPPDSAAVLDRFLAAAGR